MWANGAREDSLEFLRQFSHNVNKDMQMESEHAQRPGASKTRVAQLSKLLARCYFKQGQWQAELLDNWGNVCHSACTTRQLIRYTGKCSGNFALLCGGNAL